MAREEDGLFKGQAFIVFGTKEEAVAAVEQAQDAMLLERPMKVSFAMKRNGRGKR